ncbi:MAG: ABC transporter permease [Acetobacteraceae bacterium]|nr:ABC transporter permease [Acetobacteraceae bacterium]
MTGARISEFFGLNRWVWSLGGVLILWAILSVATSSFSLQSLSGVAVSASFLVIVALGQMLVITTGRGNIDLSIAGVITLSAFVSILVNAQAGLPVALVSVAAIGIAAGAVNAVLVVGLGIPAIIATLATGYMLATASLVANRSFAGSGVSPVLAAVAAGRIGGMPVIAIVALVVVALVSLLLGRTAYGRALSATGQNARAARLAGIRVGRVVAATFVASSVLAAFNGALLGAYVGGAFLEMGTPYILQSLGAVVLGGSLIFGGASTALGTVFGSLLLVMVVTTMQIVGLPPGTQDIVQGAVVIAVLALAGRSSIRRGRVTPRPPQPPPSGAAERLRATH